jgi:hypothetical protein
MGGRTASTSAPSHARSHAALTESIALESDEPAWLKAVSVPSTRACPHCRASLAADAVVCVSCGTNFQTGATTNVSVVKAPREPMLNGWLGPLILGGVMVLTTIIGGFSLYGSEGGFAIFAILFLFSVLPWHVWTLVDARAIPGAQLKIWLIPLYNLFYIFTISASRWLKAFTVGLIAIIITFFVLGAELERRGFFDRTEGDQVPVIRGANVPQNVRPGPPPVDPWTPRPDQIPEWDPNRGNSATKPANSKP